MLSFLTGSLDLPRASSGRTASLLNGEGVTCEGAECGPVSHFEHAANPWLSIGVLELAAFAGFCAAVRLRSRSVARARLASGRMSGPSPGELFHMIRMRRMPQEAYYEAVTRQPVREHAQAEERCRRNERDVLLVSDAQLAGIQASVADSLAAMRDAASMRRRLGVDVSLRALLERPRLADQSRMFEAHTAGNAA